MSTSGIPVQTSKDEGDRESYERLRRRVLWKLPGGLYLLGSRAGAQRNLMTCNWVMQVSTEPKQLAVSVETAALTHRLIVEGGCFSVALLAREQSAVVRKFVKPPVHDPEAHTLAGFSYRDGTTGAPIPELAAGYLECSLRQRLELGSHSLFIGEVVEAGFATDDEDVAVLRMEDTRMNYGG